MHRESLEDLLDSTERENEGRSERGETPPGNEAAKRERAVEEKCEQPRPKGVKDIVRVAPSSLANARRGPAIPSSVFLIDYGRVLRMSRGLGSFGAGRDLGHQDRSDGDEGHHDTRACP